MIDKVVAFFKTEYGRRVGVFLVTVLTAAVEGNLLPLDAPIPYLGISTNTVLLLLGVNLAAQAGSNTRK